MSGSFEAGKALAVKTSKFLQVGRFLVQGDHEKNESEHPIHQMMQSKEEDRKCKGRSLVEDEVVFNNVSIFSFSETVVLSVWRQKVSDAMCFKKFTSIISIELNNEV